MTNEKQTWGYVRLSQEGRDESLDDQKEDIRAYANNAGLNLTTTRNDGARTSGFSENRDEYQLLRDKIADAEIDAVVTRDRARLSRDFDERLHLITLFRATGVEWHVVEAGGRLNLEDVQKAGMECLHAMMDHVKKMVEIERAQAATNERLERGCYQGRPPFGLTFAADGCHLERNEDQWESCEEIWSADEHTKVDVPKATASRVKDRGREWYEDKLAEYGAMEAEKS